jgi:hypothetical protein
MAFSTASFLPEIQIVIRRCSMTVTWCLSSSCELFKVNGSHVCDTGTLKSCCVNEIPVFRRHWSVDGWPGQVLGVPGG